MTTGTWNYRIIEKTAQGEPYFEIHEVYYDANGSIHSYTENAVAPGGENLHELICDINEMQNALLRPILQEADLLKMEGDKQPPASLLAQSDEMQQLCERVVDDMSTLVRWIRKAASEAAREAGDV